MELFSIRIQRTFQLVSTIEEDKYERPLLKTFDFCAWIKSKLTDNPFDIIIKEQNKKIII